MRTNLFLLVAFFAIFTATTLSAQKEETVLGNKGFGFSGLWGGSHHQITQFGNTNSYMNGGFFGFEFGKSLLIGFSNYELKENVNWDQIQNQNFEMRFRGLNLGYGMKNYKPIHPQFNIDLAPGRIKLEGGEYDKIFVVQPAAGVEINIFRWFHLGLQGGYRFVTDSSIAGLSDKQLSGAFGQASLKFGWSWGRSNQFKKAPKSNKD